MARQITSLFDVKDGKHYFIMKVERGTVKTAVAKATVRLKGSPIVTRMDIEFTVTDGDMLPGPMDEYDYISELD